MPERRATDEALVDVLDALLGSTSRQIDGTVTRNDDGLIARVDRLESKLDNGGVRIKLPWAAWGAIWVAIIAGAAQVVAAAIT